VPTIYGRADQTRHDMFLVKCLNGADYFRSYGLKQDFSCEYKSVAALLPPAPVMTSLVHQSAAHTENDNHPPQEGVPMPPTVAVATEQNNIPSEPVAPTLPMEVHASVVISYQLIQLRCRME
jgi:hypothetical protein